MRAFVSFLPSFLPCFLISIIFLLSSRGLFSGFFILNQPCSRAMVLKILSCVEHSWYFVQFLFAICALPVPVFLLWMQSLTSLTWGHSRKSTIIKPRFEILFANWSPPCRILVDDISEWFAIFFLIYRPDRKTISCCYWERFSAPRLLQHFLSCSLLDGETDF